MEDRGIKVGFIFNNLVDGTQRVTIKMDIVRDLKEKSDGD